MHLCPSPSQTDRGENMVVCFFLSRKALNEASCANGPCTVSNCIGTPSDHPRHTHPCVSLPGSLCLSCVCPVPSSLPANAQEGAAVGCVARWSNDVNRCEWRMLLNVVNCWPVLLTWQCGGSFESQHRVLGILMARTGRKRRNRRRRKKTH